MNPYSHTQIEGMQSHTKECPGCAFRSGNDSGISEGLRMAAEMFRNSKWEASGSVPFYGYDFYQSILAKAKEMEDGK